jgi:hypothetical protein
MAVKLSHISAKCKSIQVMFDDDVLNIEYYPNKITEETFEQLNALSKMKEDTISESFMSYNTTLVGLMKSWDMLDDDGVTVLPLTAEQMIKVGIVARGKILESIMEDIRPNQTAQARNR